MRKRERRLFLSFQIDANCINARQQMPEVNELERWADEGLIEVLISQTAQNEALAGSNELRSRKAYGFIFTMSEISTPQEVAVQKRIGQILFPAGAATQNQRNDIDVVFNAAKYGRILVTTDGGSKSQPGGILGNREKLAALGLKILTPKEAVTRVREAIVFRDQNERRMSELTGEPLPEWVGKD